VLLNNEAESFLSAID